MGSLIEFFSKLLDTSDFPSRWNCGTWTSGHGWLHIISDLSTWGAYMAIPIVLVTFAFRRGKEIPFSYIYLLFAAFIMACGTVHLLEAIIFWNPVYRLSGIVKLITALVSWATVFALLRIVPQAMELPGLKKTNAKLQREINRRIEAEKDLVETEKRFRITFENAAVGMAHVAPDGSWLRTNERLSEIVGYTSEELKELRFQDITHPDDLNNDLEKFEKLLSGEIDKYAMEKRYIQKSGKIVWILLTVSLVRKENGEPDYSISIIQDISERKAIEEEAFKTQQLLAAFMDNAPSAMGVVEIPPDDSDIYHLIDNTAAEQYLDVGPGGTVGKWSLRDMRGWQPGVRRWIEKYREAQREGNTVNFQFQFMAPDSRAGGVVELEDQIWLNVNMAYLGKGEDGRDRFCYIANDDTFRQISEVKLKRSHDTFFHLIEDAPFGIYVVDAELKMRQASEGSERLFNMFDSLIGMPLDEIYRRIWNEQTAEELTQIFRDTLRTGIPHTANDSYLTRRDSDQTESFDWQIHRITLPDGEFGVVCYFYHTTKLKQAEMAARESESRLKLATELIKVGVSVCEYDQRMVIVDNIAAGHFGLNAEDAISLDNYRNCFHPEDRERLELQMEETVTPGTFENRVVEYRVVHAGGRTRWIGICMQLEYVAATDGTLAPSHWLIASIDLTERKRHEEQLDFARQQAEAANRARGEFLANMSHEIRTPMAALMGHVDILLSHLKDPDNRQSVLTIKRNGKHLLDILNDILDLSRIEAGKLEVDRTHCDLIQLLKDIDSLMRVRVNSDDVEFSIIAPEPIPQHIQTDSKRLKQILLNLVGNAIKFTEAGHIRVMVSYDAAEANIQFVVEDTGIGIPAEVLHLLFRPFSQGDASRTRKYGGSGLGLAISQRLAGLLDGRITVASEVGKGTTFTVTLPAGRVENASLTQLELDAQLDEDDVIVIRNIDAHVLLVDDRRDIRFVGQHFLEEAGARVTTASNGLKAIKAVEEAVVQGDAFQLIIMDVQMPEMDGNTAITQLRQMGYEIPILALTADAMKEDRERALASGADDYLTKPIDKATLVNRVASLTQDVSVEELGRRRAARGNGEPSCNGTSELSDE
ncbi:MAG: hypothetical protein CMJ46_04855 [Planctomyces sp.]|nr:hypothetical protein [Planctomyces sp.]